MNQLVVLEQLKPLEIFTPEGVDDILAKLTKEARSHVLDISTEAGRDHIRSLAYKIARSKTHLDDMGKDLVADAKDKIKLVDAERKRIRDSLDSLKDEIRAPLTEWENREQERVKAHEAALLGFHAAANFTGPNPPSAEVQARLDGLEALHARDWQEFAKRAELARDTARKQLSDALAASQKHEAEQAELERLRREDAERKQRERDEQIKAEAAAKAKAEAEAQAKAVAEAEAARVKAEADAEAARVKAEMEMAEQERQRLQREKEAAEREIAEADARARKAEDDRLAAIKKAEADRKAAAVQAERDRLAAEAKAAADAKNAAEKAAREKEAAVQAERDRAEATRKAEQEATAKREADKRHRAKVNNEALEALNAVMAGDGLLSAGAAAKAVVESIAKGLIPHVKISY
ncbi:coiled-coil domain-containing protein [Zavarzinella formosa]|uniref:hypothetical protein n=1 Tax=Zavarzinella formosa TaxID=360055 RepID=UPI00031EF580|nr:hypothetical protein [Zavarzinella formosa]